MALTESEISAGTLRLQANKLKVSDQESLLAYFKLYLKKKYSSEFSDLPSRLAAVVDAGGGKTASKLAAILIIFEENGFPEIELEGGRSGIKLDQAKSAVFKVRFALTLLDYELPEEFSSSLNAGSENVEHLGFGFFPSTTVKTNQRW